MGWSLPPEVRARCVSSMAAGDATKPAKPPRATRGTGPVSQRKRRTAATLAEIRVDGHAMRLPIRTVTESNTGGNRAKIGRRKQQRMIAAVGLRQMQRQSGLPAFPAAVRFVRVRPATSRAMDDDNVVSSFKAIRDEVAAFYDVDDGDPRWRWEYAPQEVGEAYEVRVEIRSVG